VAILIRPVREQFEHDRVIRELELKLRRRFGVEANVGDERRIPVKAGGTNLYPDLVLTQDEGRKPHAIVEVETSESVNHLEAMGQWARYSKARAAFYLYVPVAAVDTALRLCKNFRISPAEVWTFLPHGDQFRFIQVSPKPGLVEPDLDIAQIRADRRAAEELAEAAVATASSGDDADVEAGAASHRQAPDARTGTTTARRSPRSAGRDQDAAPTKAARAAGAKAVRAQGSAPVSGKGAKVASGTDKKGASATRSAPTTPKGRSAPKASATATKSRTAAVTPKKPAKTPATSATAKTKGATRTTTPSRPSKATARTPAGKKGNGAAGIGASRSTRAVAKPAALKGARRAGPQSPPASTRRASTTTSTRKPSAAKAPARSAPARPVASTGRSATRSTAKARGTQKRR
jgi:hypothetical protein